MTTCDANPARVGGWWVWADGTRLPVVSGGADGDGGQEGGAGSGGQGSGLEGGSGGQRGGGQGTGSGDPGGQGQGLGGEFKPPASQEELDALVNERLTARFDQEFGKRRSKWEKDVADFLQAEAKKQGMEGDAKDLVAQAEAKANEKQQAADERVKATEAKVAAIAAGAKADRVGALLKLADLSGVEMGDDGNPKPDQLQAAVEKTLTENPEFKASPNGAGQPAGSSGGDFNGSGSEHVFTRDEIAKMSPADYEKNEEKILEQTAKGLIK